MKYEIRFRKGIAAGLFALVASLTSYGFAEEIANYSNCDTCPGNIAYRGGEAREILGRSGFQMLREMKPLTRRALKVDLEDFKQSTSKDPSSGREIEIRAHRIGIHIKSLLDGSYIQVVVDQEKARASNVLELWRPEIYLQSPESNKISLKDPLEVAWEKMKTSHLYEWAFGGQGGKRAPSLLGQRILKALQMVAENPS
jgi:hypothetical protein